MLSVVRPDYVTGKIKWSINTKTTKMAISNIQRILKGYCQLIARAWYKMVKEMWLQVPYGGHGCNLEG
jgi:hypothetical protein